MPVQRCETGNDLECVLCHKMRGKLHATLVASPSFEIVCSATHSERASVEVVLRLVVKKLQPGPKRWWSYIEA